MYLQKTNKIIYRLIILSLFSINYFNNYAQTNHLQNIISPNQWDSLFPKRAGTTASHPQGYTKDFYSYNNLNQAANDMADYYVKIRTKKAVWGQLITVTKKSTMETYVYSDVENWWYSNKTPETVVIIDFESFINEQSPSHNKRELAAFLANISKETTGGWQFPVGGGTFGDYASWGLYFVHEVGYNSSNSAGSYSQSHTEYPPNPTVGYYGRGPIQLSWNYNYGQFSKFIFNDKTILLNNPDTLQKNGVLAFKSAIWFWMMPQCPKPSCHQVMHDQWMPDSINYSASKMLLRGFAHTNNIINGGLECRSNSSNAFTQKVELRSELYKFYLKKMGIAKNLILKEDSSIYTTRCYESSSSAMQDYVNCNTINSLVGFVGHDHHIVCDSLKWLDGKTYTKNNQIAVYRINSGAKNGKDSIVFLNLKIKKSSKSIDKQTACNALTWIDGKTYTESINSATFTIANGAHNGCDSITTLNLTILKNTHAVDNQTACNALTWIDGKTYTESNDSATFTIANGAHNGCDSITTLNLTILKNTHAVDNQIACNTLTWLDGKTYTESNNSATFKLVNSKGCDSIITLNLTLNKVSDISTTQISDSIIANNTNASYQWLDCGQNYAIIPEENKQTFTAKINGNYAVELSENGCIDTSSCIVIESLKIINNPLGALLKIYPNSTSGVLNILFNENMQEVNIVLRTVYGQEILKKTYSSIKEVSLMIEHEAGIYFLEILTNNKKAHFKIVKE